jgi:hypothetical protein
MIFLLMYCSISLKRKAGASILTPTKVMKTDTGSLVKVPYAREQDLDVA